MNLDKLNKKIFFIIFIFLISKKNGDWDWGSLQKTNTINNIYGRKFRK